MARFKDVITKTDHLTTEITGSGGRRAMEISVNRKFADALSEWGDDWYHGLIHAKPEKDKEKIGSTPEEALEWWVRKRGFALDMLRIRITHTQQAVLDEIWRYFQEKHSSIPIIILYEKFSVSLVHETLEQLGSGIVVTDPALDKKMNYCQLTFLGGLLTSFGEDGERLLATYLKYVLELFKSDHEFRPISSREIEDELSLTKQQSYLLRDLISLGRFGTGAGSSGDEWHTSFPTASIIVSATGPRI